MKRIFITVIVLASLVACNSNSDSSKEAADKKDEKKEEVSITDNPDYIAGLALIEKSDCLTCHRPTEKLTGPSYQDVANKYASQAPGIIPQLAEKIINGGSGVWGQVPMLPHKSISQADAETMVKYVLLLKSN
jgi:cytochrome c